MAERIQGSLREQHPQAANWSFMNRLRISGAPLRGDDALGLADGLPPEQIRYAVDPIPYHTPAATV